MFGPHLMDTNANLKEAVGNDLIPAHASARSQLFQIGVVGRFQNQQWYLVRIMYRVLCTEITPGVRCFVKNGDNSFVHTRTTSYC